MDRPVFIIGCPRSGTTISLELLSIHESFAWVSNIVNQTPTKLGFTRFNRFYDDPVIGKNLLLKRQHVNTIPQPVEPWRFWNTYLSNFQWKRGGLTPPRRHDKNDITAQEIKTIRNVTRDICRHQNKKRFLSKYTDFPRIRYLVQAFPDAIFLHIVRDGRAVAYSYYNQIEKGSFHTWDERNWWVRGWPAPWRKEWLEKYNNPLGFVAYQWKFFVNEIWKDSEYLSPDQIMEINYRDLMENPKEMLKKVFNKCGLKESERVKWYLGHMPLANMNYKWQEDLSAVQRKILEEITSEGKFKRLLDNNI